MRFRLDAILFIVILAEVFSVYLLWDSIKGKEQPVQVGTNIFEDDSRSPWEGWDFTDGCRSIPPKSFSELILSASEDFDVDPRILAVTVYRESSCDSWALGSSGEIGLTQILPRIWLPELRAAGILRRSQELWDPRINLRASAWILTKLHRQAWGSTYGMFRRYNGAGPAAREYANEQEQALLLIGSPMNPKI